MGLMEGQGTQNMEWTTEYSRKAVPKPEKKMGWWSWRVVTLGPRRTMRPTPSEPQSPGWCKPVLWGAGSCLVKGP